MPPAQRAKLRKPTSVGDGANATTAYLVNYISRQFGPLYVFRAKLPTFPDTWANARSMPDGEVQYWSVATMASFINGSLWDGVFDMQVPVDKAGYDNIVVSLPEDPPKNATAENGIARINWGPGEGIGDPRNRKDWGALLMRFMVPRKDWPPSWGLTIPKAITQPRRSLRRRENDLNRSEQRKQGENLACAGSGRISRHRLHRSPVQFHERILFQGFDNGGQLAPKEFPQFPCANVAGSHQQQLPGAMVQDMRVVEVGVLGNNDALLGAGQLVDEPVGSRVVRRKSARVNGVVSRSIKKGAETRRQVGVHQESHANARCWLFNWSEHLANSRHASRSSRSRSGNSRTTSSIESPAARYSSMDSTGYRNPRMTGLPWQISGSMVMRESS